MIKLLAMDIDGVLTDGKIYINSDNSETKTLCFQDFDSLSTLKSIGIRLAIITGENGYFSDWVESKFKPDYMYMGCKDKSRALYEIVAQENILLHEVAYVGDGKYDIDAIKMAGIGFCPKNAIPSATKIADVVLKSDGGNGCLREIVEYLLNNNDKRDDESLDHEGSVGYNGVTRMLEDHYKLAEKVINSDYVKSRIVEAINCIYECFKRNGQLLLCGNGGSAADSQHIATEFVSRFFMERKALNAEALTVNTSSLTAISNDYDYDRVFARQVEAKGRPGDVIIGISTSGSSKNVMKALDSAREIGMTAIAFTGIKDTVAKEHADIVIAIPSDCTPRIQEMHILIGHIICEEVEKRLFG